MNQEHRADSNYGSLLAAEARIEELERALARLTAAASAVATQPPITVNREAWLDRMAELIAAIAEATAALGAEAGGEGSG